MKVSLSLRLKLCFQTTDNRGSTGIGNFGRLKAQRVKSLAMRSAHLKRENSERARVNRHDKSTFYGSGEEESVFERRKSISSDSASRANMGSSERTRSAHSLNSVLGQYRADNDLDILSSEAPSDSKRWGDITDVTLGRQNRKPKGPFLDNGFFSRKSFKEIGCNDDILRAFRYFEFPRPSHIQVNDPCPKKKPSLNCCIYALNPTENL
jgi:ATP-dependent RNA helicase DDX18/HAS1